MSPATGPLGVLAIAPAEVDAARTRALGRPLDHADELARTVCGRLDDLARRDPEAEVLRGAGGALSAQELLSRVVVARTLLVRHGVRAGDVVAVAGPRAAQTLVAFLAVEALDAVYLPVDPHWPSARTATVLRLSGARTVLVHASPAGDVEKAARDTGAAVVELSAPAGTAPGGDPGDLPASCDPATPRYVIFTSGTTGTPKGAVVEHRSMVNHLRGKVLDLGVGPGSRVAFTAPTVFDIAVWQMLVGPFAGATTVVLDHDDTSFPARTLAAFAREGVTHAELVPAMVGRLLDQVERRSATLPALRWLVSTGEELYPALARRVHDVLPGVRLLNAYGPTECGDDVTHHEVTPACTAAVRLPVGGPVPNVDLYVLVEGADAWRAAADGEPGELFVGGVCVGLGYVGDPSATARAFFRDPFDPGSPTGRLYRTGDLARVEGGAVHYLGRSDRQVKVAGVRMELGEVEAVGERHPGVERCAVVVERATAGGDRLTAYVVPVTDPVPDAELGAHFATYLPAAMVPRAVVHLTELPLTPHGKTDHARLTSGRTA